MTNIDFIEDKKKVSKQVLPPEVLKNILETSLIVVGAKQHGKSNSVKVIGREIIKQQAIPIQVKIFDTCQNWVHEFEPIPYQTINDDTRLVYGGKKHILFDIELMDIEKIMKFTGEVIKRDYIQQRELKRKMGGKHFMEWKLYIIEEAQNILGSYSLTRQDGKMWLKMVSESANFNMGFIFIGQRMSDISAKIIERAQGYLFGRATGDNDIAKIRRKCGKDLGIHEDVKTLKRGEFIYYFGKRLPFNCPKYDGKTKPTLWQPSLKRPIWGKSK